MLNGTASCLLHSSLHVLIVWQSGYGQYCEIRTCMLNSLFLRIEHTEVRHMGQAFRLGRYAIHFHLSGTVNGSYVRNCAIHHSFNRALTAHGIHNLLVEGNVAYDIMGHTYFVVSCLCNTPPPPPCVGNRQSLKL